MAIAKLKLSKTHEGRKLLVMGANTETVDLVRAAKSLGIKTYVVDPCPGAPAKRYADVGVHLDAMDEGKILSLIERENIDGVIVGVADPLVRTYHNICSILGVPSYTTDRAIEIFTNKVKFEKECRAIGISTVPSYCSTELISDLKSCATKLPILIKPRNGRSGVGITVCRSISDIVDAVTSARASSLLDQLIFQKLMVGEDIQAYYTILDGEPILSCLIDRSLFYYNYNTGPVCRQNSYSSKNIDVFNKSFNDKFKQLIRESGIVNGVLSVQCLVVRSDVFPYDPGLRLQGEAPHILLKCRTGLDHLQFLVINALGGILKYNLGQATSNLKDVFRGCYSFWFLLDPGTISKVIGINSLRKHPGVIQIVQRLNVGDVVEPEMMGTERQVFARVYVSLADESHSSISSLMNCFDGVRVEDSVGRDMVLTRPSL